RIQNVAGGRLCDQGVRVLLQQKALGDRVRRRGSHRRDVARVVLVALLEGGPRVTRDLVGLFHGERDHATDVVAELVLVEPGGSDVPAEVDRKSTRLNSSHQIISYA